ncbi:MAG: hypothetical protein WC755_06490 [Candidatus Woesearchaeota archaeon]
MTTGIVKLYKEQDLEKLKGNKTVRDNSISLYLTCRESAGSTLVIEKNGKTIEKIDLFNIINDTQIRDNEKRKIAEFQNVFDNNKIVSHDEYFTKKDDNFLINTCFGKRNIYYLHSLPILQFITDCLDVEKIGEQDYKLNKQLYKRLFQI